MVPLNAVGKEYVVSKTWPRGKAPDLIRVVAVEDNTSIQVSPAVTTIPVLNKGQHFDFEINSDIYMTSTRPFIVGQFLEGQAAPGAAHIGCFDKFTGQACTGGTCVCADPSNPGNPGKSCSSDVDCSPEDADIGDPTFILDVPVEQFRNKYVFLVPNKYSNNYINVIAKQDTAVTLDGTTIDTGQFKPVEGSQYMVTRLQMEEGSHAISSDQPMSIIVYGWGWYISYGYPGGMNVKAIYTP